MRKIFSILAATMILTTTLCAQEISLKINDQVIETEVQPIQEDGTTLVPIRVVTEYLGAQVEWNEETQTVTIVKANQKIELTIGSKVVKVNSVEQTLQCAPKLIEGTTMVPIRLVSENFGGTVGWEEETGTVSIQTNTVNVSQTTDTNETTDKDNTVDTSNEADTDDTNEEILIGEVKYSDATYTGEYILVEGKRIPHGQGKVVLNDGGYNEGTFENGKLVYGKKVWADGISAEGTFENNQLVDGKMTTQDGFLTLEGHFEGDELYEGTVTYVFEEAGFKAILPTKKGVIENAYIYDLEGELITTMTYEEFEDMFK